MKLSVISSGSDSNGYVIHNEKEALILEAGTKLKDVMKAIDFNISIINGLIFSHIHGDHCRRLEEYLEVGIPCFASKGSVENFKYKKSLLPNICYHGKQFKLGNFTVMPFDVIHDCANPFGYLISHPESGKILFITDTHYSEYSFKGLNHILLEANYDDKILEENISSGRVHPAMRNRLKTSHLSLQTCKDLLSANDMTNVRNIVLLHLSNANSNAKQFKEEIIAHTGKQVYIAEKGLQIDFNLNPF